MDFTDNNYKEYLHDKALDLLEKKGVAAESFIIDRVKDFEGICHRDGRLYFKHSLVQKVLDENNALISNNITKPEFWDSGKTIRIGVCDLPQYYHSPESGKTELMTVKSLVDSVKFLESIKQNKAGVWSMVPGVPRDVPYRLQAITEYYIGCEYCSSGGNVDTIYPDEAIDYIFQMAEAMGTPFKSAAMFTLSPLKLGGFEMAVAFSRIDYFDSFSISSLPMPGSTGPIFLTPAWIVSIAEAAAGAVTLYLASGGKPVYISTGMFPYEPRKAWVAGGMPEHSVMEYQRGMIGLRYNPTLTYSHSMTTSAKEPGFQAAAEKSAGAMFAAAKGCREFNTAGLLSFDDIFSPVQFVLDVEIRDLVQAYTNGPSEDCADLDKVISEGIKVGYFAADTTLDNYEKAYYFPDLFDRNPLDKKLSRAAGDDSVYAAKIKALDYIRKYNYSPDQARLTTVRKIFNSAWDRLAPGCENPLKHLQNK